MGEREISRYTRNVFETLQMLVKRAESADLQARRGADPSATLEQIKQKLTQVQNEIDTALQSIREQQEEAKQREQTKPDILKQMDILRQRHYTEQIPQLPPLIQARPASPPRPVPRPVSPPRATTLSLRAPSPPRGDLRVMTVTQLKDLDRQRGLRGYSTKTKSELITMLQ